MIQYTLWWSINDCSEVYLNKTKYFRLHEIILSAPWNGCPLIKIIFLDSQSVSIFRFYQVQELVAGVDIGCLSHLSQTLYMLDTHWTTLLATCVMSSFNNHLHITIDNKTYSKVSQSSEQGAPYHAMWKLDPSFQQDGAYMLHLPYTWESAEKELKERERKERNGRGQGKCQVVRHRLWLTATPFWSVNILFTNIKADVA